MKVGEIWQHKESETEVIEIVKYLEKDYWLIKLINSTIFDSGRFKNMSKEVFGEGIPMSGAVIFATFNKIVDSKEEYNANIRKGG